MPSPLPSLNSLALTCILTLTQHLTLYPNTFILTSLHPIPSPYALTTTPYPNILISILSPAPCWQMDSIGKLSDDMRRHFRMKLRNLFTKFIRKFGYVHRGVMFRG